MIGGYKLNFHRGYDERIYDALMKASRYIARCSSCKYLNAEGECDHTYVTPFDIVGEGDDRHCAFWRPEDYETKEIKQ